MEWHMGKILVCLVILPLSVAASLFCASRDQEWDLRWSSRGITALFGLCAGNAVCIILSGERPIWAWIAFDILSGCLLAATIMDWHEHKVYRFVWWVGGTAGLFLALGMKIPLKLWCQLMVFWALQELWFARFYGRADSHAFCVCALGMAAQGWGFSDYVMHMFLVFTGLTLIQLIRGNVGRDGNLKNAVPLLPYITTAFWLWVDFSRRKWYI